MDDRARLQAVDRPEQGVPVYGVDDQRFGA